MEKALAETTKEKDTIIFGLNEELRQNHEHTNALKAEYREEKTKNRDFKIELEGLR